MYKPSPPTVVHVSSLFLRIGNAGTPLINVQENLVHGTSSSVMINFDRSNGVNDDRVNLIDNIFIDVQGISFSGGGGNPKLTARGNQYFTTHSVPPALPDYEQNTTPLTLPNGRTPSIERFRQVMNSATKL